MSVPPEQTVVAEGVAVTPVGEEETVIDDVVTVVVPHELVAARVYMPDDNVLTVNAAGDSRVDEYPEGPLHKYEIAPVAPPVRVRLAPGHKEVAEGVAETPVGAVLTEIATEVTVVVPQELVAEKVYMPAEPVVTANEGDCNVEEYDEGPLQEYDVAPVAAPVSVSVFPLHNDVDEGVIETEVGAEEQPVETAVTLTLSRVILGRLPDDPPVPL